MRYLFYHSSTYKIPRVYIARDVSGAVLFSLVTSCHVFLVFGFEFGGFGFEYPKSQFFVTLMGDFWNWGRVVSRVGRQL